MYLIFVCHCSTSAPIGDIATMSIRPVCSPVSTSVSGSVTGDKASASIDA